MTEHEDWLDESPPVVELDDRAGHALASLGDRRDRKPTGIPPGLEHALVEWVRCELSFPYFLKYVKLQDANKGIIPLAPWPHLLGMARDWQTGQSWMEGKARQVGVSWLLAAYDVWKMTFQDHATILSISMGEVYSIQLLKKVKFIHEHLPAFLQRRVRKANNSEFEFADNGSSMMALPSTENAGRSFTASLVQFDEFAFHPFAAENYDSVRAAILDGGQMLVVTTGNGPDNTFARLWGDEAAPFRKRFTPWHSRPGRSQEWYDNERASYMKNDRISYFERENPSSIAEMLAAVVGLVYKAYDDATHLQTAEWDWKSAQYRVAGLDPGQGDPFAILPIGQHPGGQQHVFDEFYKPGIVTVDDVREYLQSWHQIAPFDAIFCDKNEPTLITTLNAPDQYGRTLPAVPAVMYTEVGQGISVVHSRLAMKTLTVAPHCENLRREFKTFRWSTKRAAGQDPWATSTPVDHHGDALACLRYGITGLSKGFLRNLPDLQPDLSLPPGPVHMPIVTNDPLAKLHEQGMGDEMARLVGAMGVRPSRHNQPVRMGPDYRRGHRTVRMGRR